MAQEYRQSIETIRELYGDIPRAYLDNAAAPLYPHSIPKRAAEYLCSHTLVNPHSRGSLGDATIQMIDNVRLRVLELVDASPEEYSVVFTLNATAAAKLVGEALGSMCFMYLVDSHTSIVGLRDLAKRSSAVESIIESHVDHDWVVSWPMQSNFDGTIYPTRQWLQHCHDRGAVTLLDCASYCSTQQLHLSELGPDFAILSFYKLFGLPDLGALFIRKDSQGMSLMRTRKYFGGGTVAALAPRSDFVARRTAISDSLEDGTVPFHTIAVLGVAIDEFMKLYGSFDAISHHTKSLAQECWRKLRLTPGVRVWSREPGHVTEDGCSCGAIVTFTLDNCGHSEFATAAAAADIHLRAGTLCNIGAFATAIGLSDSKIIINHTKYGKVCNDNVDNLNGQQMGVLRASFGPYSTQKEVQVLVDFVQSTFTPGDTPAMRPTPNPVTTASVSELYIYPIKSCAGTLVTEAAITPDGLLHDREFCLVRIPTYRIMSLKRNLAMATIKSEITDKQLKVSLPGRSEPLSIPLDVRQWGEDIYCIDELVVNTSNHIVEALTKATGTPCTIAKGDNSLANASPILLVSKTSAESLACDWRIFRANIVISTTEPWCEDSWDSLRVKDSSAKLQLLGKCRRCNMVCVTADGQSCAEPYLQLCRYRKINGKIWFGQHMTLNEKDTSRPVIRVGDELDATLTVEPKEFDSRLI